MLRPTMLALAFLTLLRAAAGEDPAAAPMVAREAADTTLVGYLPIDGEIDELKARYFKRALAQARADGVATLIVHITSDGGELFAGRDMLTTSLAVPEGAPRLVAFVDDRAVSAAAMLAYGQDEILMTPHASIGDIGVIEIGAGGKIEYAPEKFETVVRGLLRQAAQRRGWNQAKLVKMTARNQELYRFDVDAAPVFVLEEDLGTWLADHPGVDAAKKILVRPKDSLLYYTSREAVEQAMATALVDDLPAVYARLGVAAGAVRSYAPTAVERISWKLAAFAPLMLGAAVLLLIMEFKMPGTLLWAVLAGIAFAAFCLCQYYQELAGNLEIVLMIAGAIAVLVEILFVPTAGFLGVVGAVAALAGAILAFMPDDVQFRPSADGFADALTRAVGSAGLSLAMITAGAALIIWRLPRSRALRWLAANAEISSTSAGPVEAAAATIVGRRATARTDLRPTGFIALDGADLGAIVEDGGHVAAGAPVEIVAMRFGEAIVRSAGGDA